MSDKSSLQFRITGADYEGQSQLEDDSALGGFASSAFANSLQALPRSPWINVDILYVSGDNGEGTGVIDAIDENTLRYTPPNGTSGDEIEIFAGDTVMLQADGDDAPYIIVRRTSEADLGGSSAVQFFGAINNMVGGPDHTSTGVASEKYQGGMFLNTDDTDDVTDLTVWFSPTEQARATDNIAKETPGGSGDIQVIASFGIQPTGLSWVHPTTEGTGVVIGTVAAGATYGLWFERIVAALASGTDSQKVHVHYSWTQGGIDFTDVAFGYDRVREVALEVAELLVETTIPDPDVHAPKATEAWTLDEDTGLPVYDPLSYTASLTGPATYYARVFIRNGYNLLSAEDDGRTFDIDAGGNLLPVRPQAPTNQQVLPIEGGKALINARYDPLGEGRTKAVISALRADQWVVFYTGNGVAPDPLVDTPVIVDMFGDGGNNNLGEEVLELETTDAYLDGAPVEAAIFVRREADTVDSLTTDFPIGNVSITGPVRPRGLLFLSGARAIAAQPQSFTTGTLVIDAGTSTAIYHEGESSALYTGGGPGVGTLIWRCLFDSANPDRSRLYIPTVIDLIEDDSSFGAATISPWDNFDVFSGTEIYIATQTEEGTTGTRRVKIDLSANEIRAAEFAMAVPDMTQISFEGPLLNRYNEALFLVYDQAIESWQPYLSMNSDGLFSSRLSVHQGLTQVQIEALAP